MLWQVLNTRNWSKKYISSRSYSDTISSFCYQFKVFNSGIFPAFLYCGKYCGKIPKKTNLLKERFFGYRFQMIQSMTIQAHVIDSDIKPTITTETEYLIKTVFFMPAWMVFHISTWKLYEEVQNKICIPGRQTPNYLFLLTSSVSEVSTFNNKLHINDCLHQQKTNLVISWTFEKMLNIKKKNSLTHA